MGDDKSADKFDELFFLGPSPPPFLLLAWILRARPVVQPVLDQPTDARLDWPFPEPSEVTPLPKLPTEPVSKWEAQASQEAQVSPPDAPPEQHGNDASYFSEIASAFAAHRGEPYCLSPLDWALIERWHKDGIPLPVVLRAITQTFATRAQNAASHPQGRPRPVRSLAYCRQAVEEAFQAYRASQVGKTDAAADTGSPSPTQVIGFLKTAVQTIQTAHRNLAAQVRLDAPHAQLRACLSDVAAQLTAWIERLQSEAILPLEALETALSEMEDSLLTALQQDAPSEVKAMAMAEATATLKPHRKRMTAAVYAQAHANYVTRLLRQQYGIPRLSLFSLEED